MSAPRPASEWVLSAALAVLACSVAVAMWPASVNAVLRLELSKSAVAISGLDQPRRIVKQVTRWVDVLDLARDGRLEHPVLGGLGLGEHYYLDLRTRIEVLATASFRFQVGSDDGFELKIDQRRVCAYTTDRAFTTQTCNVLLLAGPHTLELAYFQGSGPAGLAVRYAAGNQTGWSWLGEDSAALRFLAD